MRRKHKIQYTGNGRGTNNIKKNKIQNLTLLFLRGQILLTVVADFYLGARTFNLENFYVRDRAWCVRLYGEIIPEL